MPKWTLKLKTKGSGKWQPYTGDVSLNTMDEAGTNCNRWSCVALSHGGIDSAEEAFGSWHVEKKDEQESIDSRQSSKYAVTNCYRWS